MPFARRVKVIVEIIVFYCGVLDIKVEAIYMVFYKLFRPVEPLNNFYKVVINWLGN